MRNKHWTSHEVDEFSSHADLLYHLSFVLTGRMDATVHDGESQSQRILSYQKRTTPKINERNRNCHNKVEKKSMVCESSKVCLSWIYSVFVRLHAVKVQ